MVYHAKACHFGIITIRELNTEVTQLKVFFLKAQE